MSTHLFDIDTGQLIPKSVLVSQFRNNGNRIQTGVLCKSGGNDFESFGVGLETICFLALEGLSILRKQS
jgi:hypothetical protein